jgi:homoaconitase/3-isopropylmalate dehydratase large subunit
VFPQSKQATPPQRGAFGGQIHGQNIIRKILTSHLTNPKITPDEQAGLTIDHILTQDSTGTLAYLEFQAMDVPQVKTKLSLSFVDHKTHCRTTSEMPTTTATCKASPLDTALSLAVQATGSTTNSTLNV